MKGCVIMESMDVNISVIVPVYNVFEWLDQCMESIVNQTYDKFEILLINDGSTDGSDEKCEEWASRDKRIRYFSKENEGLAVTRNFGLKKARGEYIVFIDSDDWIDARFLELLYSKIKETGADIVECDFWRYNNNTGEKTYRACYGRMGTEYSLEEHMVYGQSMAWKYISRKKLWTDNGIEMPDCTSASHGIYALLLALSGKIANVHEALYYYRRFRKGSIVETNGRSGNQKGILGISALRFLVEEFYKRGLYETYQNVLERIVTYSLSDYLAAQFVRMEKEDFRVLSNSYYDFVSSAFPKLPNEKYITLGGYNFNRILVYLNKIHNPYCRFNFSSVISIMSPCSEEMTCRHKNKYRNIMINRDISAKFWDILEETKPTYIFIDFLEERFDIIEYRGAYITKSDAFDGIEEKIEGYNVIPWDSKERKQIWQNKCLEFISELQKYFQKDNIVLVKNYLSEYVGDGSGKRKFDDIDEIRRVNERLKEYYDFFSENCENIVVVEASLSSMYFTDYGYEYGAIPSHLNEIVNEEIAKTIEKLID